MGLRPGSYTVTETQPGAFNDGKDTAGTTGGTAGNILARECVVTWGYRTTPGEDQPALERRARAWLDDVLLPLYRQSPQHDPMLALYAQGENSVSWGHLMAGSGLSTLPILVVFVIAFGFDYYVVS